MGNRSPPTFRHGRISSQISAPSMVLFSVGCCVDLARGSRSRPRPGPPLSLFCCPICRPRRQEKVLPMRSASVVSHEIAPPPPQLTFGWLLCLLTKRRPPKVAAPPISIFFDGCPFGAPKTRGRRVTRMVCAP